MNITQTTYIKDFFNALIGKCHRYRWFLLGAIAATIVMSIAGSFFENQYYGYVGGSNSYERIQIGTPLAIIIPMIIATVLTVLINLPNEQRYQLTCAKGRLTPMLVNSTIALMLTLVFALITAFTPAFVSTCGILSAISSNGYYDNLLFTSSELLLDFGYCLIISWIVIGSANKFMYYLKINPKLLILWGISIGSVFGIMVLAYSIMLENTPYIDIDIELNQLTFIYLAVSAVLYEGLNILIKIFSIRKGDVSR